MNLDRLKALIRLANNNPNDHEANLAARKACKLIAEDDFAILRSSHVPRTAADKIRTWNDVTRSTEPAFRSKQQPPNHNDFEDMFDEIFNKHVRSRPNPFRGYDWSKAPRKEAPEPSSYDTETPKYKPFTRDWMPNDYVKEPKPEELRKCARCGLEIMTKRLKEDPWICNPCHWKEKL